MGKVRFTISMSLDGYTAGPSQSRKEPLGIGGEGLHQWVTALAAWRQSHGLEGGEVNESTPLLEESMSGVGATIMGRNMFGGHPGPWDPAKPWTGWWGKNPPFHHPVFVLTHYERAPLRMDGETTFTFVTDGFESALRQARAAAGDRHITIAGGANAAQQYLKAGVVDEMLLHQVPILLGAGERLFQGVKDLGDLALVETVALPNVTHFRFVRS
jgi:dihydrofolate reductase